MVKILVVDDEQRIREMIRKYAEYEGFAVDEACDGLEAVDKALKENYDLIVMDIMMPNLDGFQRAGKSAKRMKPYRLFCCRHWARNTIKFMDSIWASTITLSSRSRRRS